MAGSAWKPLEGLFEPPPGIEPGTLALRKRCSTTELGRPMERGFLPRYQRSVKRGPSPGRLVPEALDWIALAKRRQPGGRRGVARLCGGHRARCRRCRRCRTLRVFLVVAVAGTVAGWDSPARFRPVLDGRERGRELVFSWSGGLEGHLHIGEAGQMKAVVDLASVGGPDVEHGRGPESVVVVHADHLRARWLGGGP